MKDIYVKYNDELIYIGYAKEFIYEGETNILVNRKGMNEEVYKPKEFKEFIKKSNFILK